MKTIAHQLKLPWLARIPSGTGLFSTILIPAVFSLLAVQQVHAFDGLQQLGAGVLVFAVILIWTLAPGVLRLARDASSLRVPSAAREVDRCLLLYVVLSIPLPALVLGAIFGHTLTWLVSLALMASAFFALHVLPIWLAWGGAAVLMGLLLSNQLVSVPVPGDPRYLAWATPVTLVLAVACLQRYFALTRSTVAETRRWWMAGLQTQGLVRLNALRGGGYPATAGQFGRYAGKRQDAVLSRRFGPAFPVRSIRLATDPLAGPNSQRAWRWTIACGVSVAAALLFLLTQHILPTRARTFIATQLPIWGFLFLSEWIPASGSLLSKHRMMPTARWSGRHGELPLLALLPHLAESGNSRRAALLACLHGRVLWLACALVALTLVAATLQMPDDIYPILLVIALSGLALDAAVALYTLAGRPLRGATRFAPGLAILVLLGVSIGLWSAALPDATPTTPSPHGGILMLAILALWATWLVMLAIFARRGWRLLQLRPHPFLAHPSP